jgi:hypothetical protein
MKRPIKLLAACLTATAAMVSIFAIAAEGAATQQDLLNVKASPQVVSATWRRQADSYSLQVVIDPSRIPVANVADVLRSLPPQNISTQPVPIPNWQEDAPSKAERDSFFIGNTIANLRGMDPVFCGRTLTLVDGRRMSGNAAQAPPPNNPQLTGKNPWVSVWLLKADGTAIQPATYSCVLASRTEPGNPQNSMLYGYPVAEGAQAVAVTIRIGSDFYVEKLQPLATPAEL